MKFYGNYIINISFILLLVLFCFTTNITSAQSTINASGGSKSFPIGIFDYSIGEMMVVSTNSNAGITVTQGLLQVENATLGTSEEILSKQDLTVFPNPTVDLLYLKPSLEGGGELLIEIFDLQGRRISEYEFDLKTGLEKQKLDLSFLQDATYMLNVKYNHDKKRYRQTYKIVKSSL